MANDLIENAFSEFLTANERRLSGYSQEQLDLLGDAFRDGFAIGSLTRDNPVLEAWLDGLKNAATTDAGPRWPSPADLEGSNVRPFNPDKKRPRRSGAG